MGKRLFVGNLPFSTTAEEIRALFAQFGEVADVHIVIDRETSRPRGFGFVSFATDEQAARATEKMNGQMMGGRPLVVKDARDRGAPAPPGERGPRPMRPARDGTRPAGSGGAGAGRPWQPRFPRMPMPDPAEMPAEAERRRFAVKKRRPEGEADRAPKVRLREEEEVRTGHWRQWIEEDGETDEQEGTDEQEATNEQGGTKEQEEAPPSGAAEEQPTEPGEDSDEEEKP
jgi:hypothetical protein